MTGSSSSSNQRTIGGKPLICLCVKRHSPKALVVEIHHIEPISWGGAIDKSNQIALCVQTHYTVHAILNLYVHAKGTPDRALLQSFPSYARQVATMGWAKHLTNNPTHPTPYGP